MTKKYDIIYADPPWKYQNEGAGLRGVASAHYPTMSIDELCKLGKNFVTKITNDRAVLILWTTFPQLKSAFKVIKAWGFKYKTIWALWIKIKKGHGTLIKTGQVIPIPITGYGFYTRSNAEICLLATKGTQISKLKNTVQKAIPQVVMVPRREHSRKPDEVREMIDEFFDEKATRIELFARETVKHWDCWGNETEKFNVE